MDDIMDKTEVAIDPYFVIMHVSGSTDHKNYAEVGRIFASAIWQVFLNLVQLIVTVLPKIPERLQCSLDRDPSVNVHIPGFSPGYNLAQGECLYSSLSYLWTGNMNQMVHIFRIGSAAHAALHIEHNLRKV
ncbi:hypothetical protein CHS0354_020285 [Potamilus streckersoni]|uniref:Uncharacterized protein n=1 Tax=Potamilus streckersoni TaxID=2493646 RepID=A0AAE0S5R6_9BIVA|nr:hypothetical protein CHS0354_020285 [Potamilus streckersoni]